MRGENNTASSCSNTGFCFPINIPIMMLCVVIDTCENIALRRRCRKFLYG